MAEGDVAAVTVDLLNGSSDTTITEDVGVITVDLLNGSSDTTITEDVGAVTVDLLNGSSDTNITENVKSTTAAVSIISVVPQLLIKDSKAADAIQFYKTAFGAEELKRDIHPKRKADQELPSVVSAELKLGSFVFMVSDQTDVPNDTLANGSFKLCIEIDGDVNGVVKNAVSAGAVLDGEITEGADACCAGPVGNLNDPYGFAWLICSAKKNQEADVVA